MGGILVDDQIHDADEVVHYAANDDRADEEPLHREEQPVDKQVNAFRRGGDRGRSQIGNKLHRSPGQTATC